MAKSLQARIAVFISCVLLPISIGAAVYFAMREGSQMREQASAQAAREGFRCAGPADDQRSATHVACAVLDETVTGTQQCARRGDVGCDREGRRAQRSGAAVRRPFAGGEVRARRCDHADRGRHGDAVLQVRRQVRARLHECDEGRSRAPSARCSIRKAPRLPRSMPAVRFTAKWTFSAILTSRVTSRFETRRARPSASCTSVTKWT